ncbi:MAG: efflux RND transporter periplasmic adaptor subunit [Planctomycetaceae bacterium]|nr:efflux RND transporter periplasmic adaptor subunit [Planctomycetaceae bacterium]
MRFFLKLLTFLIVVAGLIAAAYQPTVEYWKKRNQPKFKTVKVEEGEIIEVRNATGTIKPVLEVHVGSFVSGPITELHVEFNDEVAQGDLLAKIDPLIYQASVDRDRATLATRKADIVRIKARLQNAINDEKRAMGLRSDNPDYISDTEMDQYRFARMALEGELKVAEANILQAEANLKNSEANLGYTEIRSPVDGMVTDRKIDPGQTLAAQFQTPELFIIAPDMRKEMHVFADVDEADIGHIRNAQEAGETVQFTVDAYPDELFEGKIFQIRLSPTTTQNVVTYPVIVSAPNEDLKLLPGMTAKITFPIAKRTKVIKIPNTAKRYYPQNREHVHKDDLDILDGTEQVQTDEDDQQTDEEPPADERSKASRNRNRRHVWIEKDGKLRAVAVEFGISDYKYTELVSGEIKPGQELVIGFDKKR